MKAVGLEVKLMTAPGAQATREPRQEDLKFKIVTCCKKEREIKKRGRKEGGQERKEGREGPREGEKEGGWEGGIKGRREEEEGEGMTEG